MLVCSPNLFKMWHSLSIFVLKCWDTPHASWHSRFCELHMSSHFICEKRECCVTNRQEGQKEEEEFLLFRGGRDVAKTDTLGYSWVKCCKLVQHVLCQNVFCYNWSDGQNSGVGRPSSLLFQSLILFDFNHHGNGQRGGERGCNCKVRVVCVQQEGRRLGVDWRVEVRLIENCNGTKKETSLLTKLSILLFF